MIDPVTVSSGFLGGRVGAPDPNQPRVFVTYNADFSSEANIVLDFTLINQQQVFGQPRAVFIDNGSNPHPVTVYVQGTDFFFTAPAASIGVYSLDALNNSAKIEFETLGGATDIVTITVYNWEKSPAVWYQYGAVNKDIPIKVQGAYPDGTQLPATFGNGELIAGITPDGKVKTINTDANGNIIVSNLDITIGAIYGPDAVGTAPTHPGVLIAALNPDGEIANIKVSSLGYVLTNDTAANASLEEIVTNTAKANNADVISVNAAISDTLLVDARANRIGLVVFNYITAIMYLKLGTTEATFDSYSVQVGADGYYEVPFAYTGEMRAIWSAANGSAKVTEIF